MNLENLPQLFDELCKLAAEQTLPRFRQKNEIDNKREGGFDPVTAADREAERAIRAYLEQHFPDHDIIGEEFGGTDKGSDYQWVIDPVDGTRAFVSGIPLWGTLIGLMKDNAPIAGVMEQPFTGERFYSDGAVSTYSRAGQSGRLSTSSTAEIGDAILMTTTPALFSDDEIEPYNRLEQAVKLPRYGADCYAYCLLAAGHIDLVVESGLQLYDVAALVPIIQHAGGLVTDWQGNPDPAGGQVLAAANEALHRLALEELNR